MAPTNALSAALPLAAGVALGVGGAALAEVLFGWSAPLKRALATPRKDEKEQAVNGDVEGFSLQRQSLAVASQLQASRQLVDPSQLSKADVVKTFISLVSSAWWCCCCVGRAGGGGSCAGMIAHRPSRACEHEIFLCDDAGA